MSGTARVIHGDSRHLPLADDSVDLVITSPPYFALRSYTDGGEHYAGQIGAEATPDEFVSSLLEVTAECVRVLKPSGSLWVNLGDKYAGSRMDGSSDNGTGATSLAGTASIRDRGASRGYGRKASAAVPTKSLMGIPWRYALRCIDDLGLILRAEVIWSKPNGLPESVTDRVRRSHEQWFMFTLQPRYFSAVDEIREPHVVPPHSPGQRRITSDRNDGDRNSRIFGDASLGKLPGSVWTIPTEPLRVPDHLGVDHFAAFPTEWPRRIIAGWSPAGVCTACGEGRRPVVAKVRTNGSRGVVVGAAFRPDGHWETADGKRHEFQTDATIAGYACACPCALCGPGYRFGDDGCRHAPAADTTPAVVLDPFGGTGTTALVAKALTGISVDMSADYCRLAEWRVNDAASLAHAARVDKPAPQTVGQESLLDLLGGEGA